MWLVSDSPSDKGRVNVTDAFSTVAIGSRYNFIKSIVKLACIKQKTNIRHILCNTDDDRIINEKFLISFQILIIEDFENCSKIKKEVT